MEREIMQVSWVDCPKAAPDGDELYGAWREDLDNGGDGGAFGLYVGGLE